jgi:hypothetical protein
MIVRHHKPGDIVCIPLDSSSFMAARVLRDSSIEVFNRVFDQPPEVGELNGLGILCTPGVFGTAIANGSWKVIGHIAFADDELSWPRPRFVRDLLQPDQYRIYDRGKMRPAKLAEICGLEEQRMFKPEQLIVHLRALNRASKDKSP